MEYNENLIQQILSSMNYGTVATIMIHLPIERYPTSLLVIKETKDKLNGYKQKSEVDGLKGAGYFHYGEVLIVCLMVVLDGTIYDCFYNAFKGDTISNFENFARQEFIHVLFYDGSSPDPEYETRFSNDLAPVFKQVLNEISNKPQWKSEEYKEALHELLQDYPTKESRYEALMISPSNRLSKKQSNSIGLGLLISKNIIDTMNVGETKDALDKFSKSFLDDRNRLDFFVEGYKNDPRELYEIPEVRKYFQVLFIEVPGLFYWLDIEKWLLFLGLFLYEPVKTNQGIMLKPEDLTSYLNRGIDGLIEFCKGHGVAPEPTLNEITRLLNSSQQS